MDHDDVFALQRHLGLVRDPECSILDNNPIKDTSSARGCSLNGDEFLNKGSADLLPIPERVIGVSCLLMGLRFGA